MSEECSYDDEERRKCSRATEAVDRRIDEIVNKCAYKVADKIADEIIDRIGIAIGVDLDNPSETKKLQGILAWAEMGQKTTHRGVLVAVGVLVTSMFAVIGAGVLSMLGYTSK